MNGRILFVAPSAYTLSGLATWLDYLLPGLRERGWEVTLGLTSGPRWHRPEVYLERHPDACWRAVECRTGTPEGRASAVEDVIEALGPDIVVSVNVPDALVATWRIRSESERRRDVQGPRGPRGPRGVMAVHGLQPDLFDDVSLLRDAVDAVIATNRLGSRLAVTYAGLSDHRAFYAPCGADAGRGAPAVADAGREVASTAEELVVAWIGRLEQPQKRVRDVPAVSDELSGLDVPHRILVAGTGPEEEALRESRSVADGRVVLLGFLSDSEVKAVYDTADALLITSTWETGPLVAWEAMAQGCPVVSSRYVGSGREDALRHQQTALLFESGDVRGAAEQLALLRDPETRRRVVGAGRALVEARYSRAASIGRWEEAFRTVLERSPLEPAGDPPLARPSGRLDRVVGPRLAEGLRDWTGRVGPDSGPGGEWPHSLSGTPADHPGFWEAARIEDRRTTATTGAATAGRG